VDAKITVILGLTRDRFIEVILGRI